MKQKLLLALCVIGMMASAQGSPSLTVNSNMTISGQTLFYSNIVINSGCTLTINNRSVIMIDTGCGIVVNNGATLVLDNSTITACKTDLLWEGIEICNGATIDFKNRANVVNAKNAIKTMVGNDWSTAGGTIKIEKTTFSNCRRSIEFLSYAQNANSYITNSIFRVDDDGYDYFINAGILFWSHISAYSSTVPIIRGCSFYNYHEPLGYAIILENSNLTVSGYYGNSLPNNNTFYGFKKAININNTSAYSASIQYSRFIGNIYGVKAENAGGLTVSHCSFSIPERTLVDTHRYGIHIMNCSSFSVVDNIIALDQTTNNTAYTYGIYVENSGGSLNFVSGNTINGIHNGVYVKGNNKSNLYSSVILQGLQIKCNDFIDCDSGIYIHNNSSIGNPQGLSNAGAGNSFSSNTTDIHNNGSLFTYYYYINNPTTYNVTKISASASGCGENPVTNPSPANEQYNGLSADSQILLDNMTDETIRGLYGRMTNDSDKLDSLLSLYGTLNRIEARYALAEIYDEMGQPAQADSVLSLIPEQFDMTAGQMLEYGSYVELHDVYVRMKEAGVSWCNMRPVDVYGLRSVAEQGYGRAAQRAKFLLLFHKGIDIDNPDTAAETDTKSETETNADHYFQIVFRNWCEIDAGIFIFQAQITFPNHDFVWAPKYEFDVISNTGATLSWGDSLSEAVGLKLGINPERLAQIKHWESEDYSVYSEDYSVYGYLENNIDTVAVFESGLYMGEVGLGTMTISWIGEDGRYVEGPSVMFRYEYDVCTEVFGMEEQAVCKAQAYPNPTTGIFHIETGFEGTAEVAVYDTEGRRVLSRTTEGGTVEIDLGNLPAGLYYYTIANGDRRLSGKVMKK